MEATVWMGVIYCFEHRISGLKWNFKKGLKCLLDAWKHYRNIESVYSAYTAFLLSRCCLVRASMEKKKASKVGFEA